MAAAIDEEPLELDYADWTFLAEGNAHVLLVSSHSCEGKVLRIPKRVPLETVSTANFLTHVASPLLGRQYILFPRFIQLSEEFIAALKRAVATSAPAEGRRQWDTDGITFPWMAELLPDCFSPYIIPKHLPRGVSSELLSVELKVKGGLLSYSPFLQGASLIKLRRSRFQLLHAYKHYIKHRSFDGYNVPSYRPSDLCSGDSHKIHEALLSLLRNPGNNLSIWRDGHRIFGDDIGTVDDVSRVWSSFLGDIYPEDAVGSFLATISELLGKETALTRLQRMQAFDVIDCEGCAVVFDRLASLYGGKDAALELLRNSVGDPFPFHLNELSDMLSEASLPSMPSSGEQASDFGVVAVFRSLSVSAFLSEREVGDRHAAAMTRVACLGPSECVTLLRLWLISLTAKDASLILTLVKEPGSHPETSYSGQGAMIVKTSDEGCGVVLCCGYRLDYALKFVDINCKPAEKCDSKRSSETRMLSILASYPTSV